MDWYMYFAGTAEGAVLLDRLTGEGVESAGFQ